MNTRDQEDFKTFATRLSERLPEMPTRLRQCGDFVAAHPDALPFATVADLAAAAGVQPSTVIRFAQVMGFSGYTEMRRIFRARHADGPPDYAGRLARLRQDGAGSPETLLSGFADAGHQSIDRVGQQVSLAEFSAAVQALSQARTIYLAGYRRAYPVVTYLAHAFESQKRPYLLLHGVGMLNTSPVLRPDDALVAISFSPYTSRTVEIAALAAASGASVTAISDSADSPLRPHADHWLEIDEAALGTFRSLAGTFTLATALATAIGTRAVSAIEDTP